MNRDRTGKLIIYKFLALWFFIQVIGFVLYFACRHVLCINKYDENTRVLFDKFTSFDYEPNHKCFIYDIA